MPEQFATEEQKTSTAEELAHRLTGGADGLGEAGPVWKVRPPTEAERDNNPKYIGRTLITHENGPTLALHWSDVRSGGRGPTLRLVVSGVWPQDGNHGPFVTPRDTSLSREKLTTEITVDAARPAATIAAEIKRRLLPDYMRAFEACMVTIRGRREYADRCQASVRAVIEAAGGDAHVTKHGDGKTVYLGKFSHGYAVECHGDSVSFQHLSVPIGVALKVVEALRKTEVVCELCGENPAVLALLVTGQPAACAECQQKLDAFHEHQSADPHCSCNDCIAAMEAATE